MLRRHLVPAWRRSYRSTTKKKEVGWFMCVCVCLYIVSCVCVYGCACVKRPTE